MKLARYIYGLASVLLLLLPAGCTDEAWSGTEENTVGDVNVRFEVDVPAYKVALTRTTITDENTINSLWVLVFDEKGNYLYKTQATTTPATTAPTSANGTFAATLKATIQKRIVHFIANYDAISGFDDAVLKEKDEREIVASLKGANLYMWSRMEVSGISATTFQSQTVQLLRNMAKITVEVEANSYTDKFSGGSFAVRRMSTIGTVAPFDPNAYAFAERTITEPAGVTYTASSGDVYKPVGLTNGEYNVEYMFERKNKLADADYTCVILQGTYNGTTNFYKIDLLDTDKNRHDIERNYWYKLTVKEILRPGYATEQQAMDNAAANNTSLDVIVEKYPVITDGARKLEVEKTLITFTENGSSLDTWYKYYPDVVNAPNTWNNTGVTVTLIEDDPANSLVKPGTFAYDPATGKITAQINDIPTDGSRLTARVIVKIGELSRTIRLVGEELYRFDPIRINGLDPAVIPATQGSTATLTFNIPDKYPTELLPLEVRIQTNGLTPAQPGMRMEVIGGKTYYIYTATAKGTQTVQFKTNLSSSKETVTLSAAGFTDGYVGYNVNKIHGTVAYVYNSVTTPVPYAERANLTVSAGRISMPLNTSGQYDWYYPSGLASTDQATVTFRKTMADGITRVFSQTVTVAQLEANPALTLTHTSSEVTGTKITYGTAGTVVPQGATVTAVINPASSSPVTANVEVLANGQFKLSYPVDASVTTASTVTFTYETVTQNDYDYYYGRYNGSVTDVYTQTTTMGNVATSKTVTMSTLKEIQVEGVIEYYYNYYGTYYDVTAGQASNRYIYQLGGVTQTPAYEMPRSGRYRIVLPGTTAATTNIRFGYQAYIYDSYYGYGYYWHYGTKTLTQLRSNTRMQLRR